MSSPSGPSVPTLKSRNKCLQICLILISRFERTAAVAAAKETITVITMIATITTTCKKKIIVKIKNTTVALAVHDILGALGHQGPSALVAYTTTT